MTNQAQGKKISNFSANTTIPSGSYLSFIYSGTNYKILDTDFYGALGVTGTLVQLGDSTSVPILDKQGSVNRIRNAVAGPGVKVSLTAQNGLKISHNIANGGTGDVSLFQSLTSTQLVAKKLKAGAGITLTDNGTDIEISLT